VNIYLLYRLSWYLDTKFDTGATKLPALPLKVADNCFAPLWKNIFFTKKPAIVCNNGNFG